jgi:hypothetical protein
MLAIQEFISSFDSLAEAAVWLKSKVGVLVREESLLGKPLWHCSSSAAVEDRISRESNGLVLGEENKVVCLPAIRPLLIKDIYDTRIDWSKIHIYEKSEGLRILIFWFEDAWHIGTERSVAGHENIKIHKNITSTVRFELISKLSKDFGSWQAVFDYLDNDNYCYTFLYNWPLYDGVYTSTETSFVLESIMNRNTLNEVDEEEADNFAEVFGFERPMSFYFNGLPDVGERERIPALMSPHCKGIEIKDGSGKRYFLSNKLYNALYVAKLASINILPIHVLNIGRSCRNTKDLETVRKEFPRLSPMMDILLSAEMDLVSMLGLADAGKSIINKPGAAIKAQQDIIDTAKKNIKEDKTFHGLRKALACVRADKIISYINTIDGKKINDELERLRNHGIEKNGC